MDLQKELNEWADLFIPHDSKDFRDALELNSFHQLNVEKLLALNGVSEAYVFRKKDSWKAWYYAKYQAKHALLEQFEINNKLVEQIEELKAKAQAVQETQQALNGSKMIKERKMASYLKNGIWIECDDYVDNSWNDDEGLEDVVFRIGYSKEISMFDTYDSKLDIYQIELISDMPKFYVAFCPFYSAVQNIYIHSTHDLICFFKEIKPMMDLILKDEEIKNKEMEA